MAVALDARDMSDPTNVTSDAATSDTHNMSDPTDVTSDAATSDARHTIPRRRRKLYCRFVSQAFRRLSHLSEHGVGHWSGGSGQWRS